MSFLNADGLLIRYGAEKIIPTLGGEFQGAGPRRTIELEVDATKLTTTSVILAEGVDVPRNFTIEEVELVAEVAVNNITSVSFGLIRYDRATFVGATEISLASAVLLATLTPAGKKQVLTVGSTGAGDQIGKVLPQPGLITGKVVGTLATTGKIIIRVSGYVANQETVANAQVF